MKHGPQSPDCYRFKNALFNQGIITMILSHCKIINIEKKKKNFIVSLLAPSKQNSKLKQYTRTVTMFANQWRRYLFH